MSFYFAELNKIVKLLDTEPIHHKTYRNNLSKQCQAKI